MAVRIERTSVAVHGTLSGKGGRESSSTSQCSRSGGAGTRRCHKAFQWCSKNRSWAAAPPRRERHRRRSPVPRTSCAFFVA
eukprot:381674-Pyramimonas_sp.AAC.1